MILHDRGVSAEALGDLSPTQEMDIAPKPQRLRHVMATLHYLLAFNPQAQDYHFVVDPIDHHHIVREGFPQLAHLKQLLPCGISVHFNPDAGEMTVDNVAEELSMRAKSIGVNSIKAAIAGMPGLSVHYTLSDRGRSDQMAQCLAVIERDGKPHTLILYAIRASGYHNTGGKPMTSILHHVMRSYDTIQTIARLEFGGLDGKEHKGDRDVEERVNRVASKSQVVVWNRHGRKFAKSSSEQLLQSGELRLRLPGKDAKEYKPEAVIKFSEILHEVREVASSSRSLTGKPASRSTPQPAPCSFSVSVSAVAT